MEAAPGARGAPMTPRRARGRFITLEGGEGVGKSVRRPGGLEVRLTALGLAVVRTREPGR